MLEPDTCAAAAAPSAVTPLQLEQWAKRCVFYVANVRRYAKVRGLLREQQDALALRLPGIAVELARPSTGWEERALVQAVDPDEAAATLRSALRELCRSAPASVYASRRIQCMLKKTAPSADAPSLALVQEAEALMFTLLGEAERFLESAGKFRLLYADQPAFRSIRDGVRECAGVTLGSGHVQRWFTEWQMDGGGAGESRNGALCSAAALDLLSWITTYFFPPLASPSCT